MHGKYRQEIGEMANKPGKLTRQDVTCPICWSMLVEPTTLPCNHSLCAVCFKKHVEETSLCCPCCRLRLSIWIRKVVKEINFLMKYCGRGFKTR
ncbi:hypothetical protein Ocin01_01294 [Orchesella cincta]|uniref:RING-type E3 ubiquitin transferase n=1 Tax=Orchesella cincta TaxID=48709 RepID=A0A1D2NJK6_ORCCI|nr:hypothetical protein Ocin01_01294 [Orchesella cincta]